MNEIIKNFFSNRRNFLLVLAGAGLVAGGVFWFVWGGSLTSSKYSLRLSDAKALQNSCMTDAGCCLGGYLYSNCEAAGNGWYSCDSGGSCGGGGGGSGDSGGPGGTPCPNGTYYDEIQNVCIQGYCGDGNCAQYEEYSCSRDCSSPFDGDSCGDGSCDQDEQFNLSCPLDCGYCGDGSCDQYEEFDCPQDCSDDGGSGPSDPSYCPPEFPNCNDPGSDPGGGSGGGEYPNTQNCVIPEAQWTCQPDGDCDDDGYLNPVAPQILQSLVQIPQGCIDSDDGNRCKQGTANLSTCAALIAAIPSATPTPQTSSTPLSVTPGGTQQTSTPGSSELASASTPSASTLTVRCSGNQAMLSWNIPANANSNSIQKKPATGGSWQFIMADTGLRRTTYTDTFTAPSSYRQKSGANVASNVVQCGVAATPVLSTTPSSAPPPSTPLSCEPTDQTVEVDQPARVRAIGGTGTYQWQLTGSGVAVEGGRETIGVQYSVYGEKILRVSSGGLTAACAITVNAPVVSITPTPLLSFAPSPSNIFAFATPTPTNQTNINNPSGVSVGPGGAVLLAMAIASFMSLLYAAYTRSPSFYNRDARKIGKAHNPLDFRT